METPRRHSRKRDAIFNAICSTDSHPSAEWVYTRIKDSFPDLSLGTVYRNMALFRDEGQIRRVAVVDGVDRFDANTEPHPHFVCRKCSKVIDIDQDFSLNSKELVSNGYSVESYDVTFSGVCPCCKDKN